MSSSLTPIYRVRIDYSEHKLEPIWMAIVHRSDADLPIAVLQELTLEPLMARVEMVVTYDARGTR
jgi:hypothetical protein